MRRLVPLAAAIVYAVADFPAPLAGSLAGGVDVGVVVVPFCAAFAIAFLPWGHLADRIGAMRAMTASVALLALAGVALVAAETTTALVGARALEGLAAAGFPPAAQALVTRDAAARAGRAVGAMSIGVGAGTLGGPILARQIADVTSPQAALWLMAVALPALLAIACAAFLGRDGERAPRLAPRLRLTAPLVGGWAVAALVLSAYWTALTRLDYLLGPGGAGLSPKVLGPLAVLAGAAGIACVTFAAGASDRRGPRLPMAVVLGVGGVAALASAAGPAVIAAAGLAVLLACYWSYLPVVSAQVARSSTDATRATAVAGLYASMWLGAAVGGSLAAVAPGWRLVVGGCAVAWLLAGLVASRSFHAGPVGAAS